MLQESWRHAERARREVEPGGQTPSLLAKKSWMYRSSCSRKWNSITSSIENAGPAGMVRLGVRVVEEHGRLRWVAIGLRDVDAGRDEQRHDLAVGTLLDVVGASRAGEPVAPLASVVADGQQDRLGSHVHFSASGAGRSDGCHLTPSYRR